MAQIAKRAGPTERTFFRHFADTLRRRGVTDPAASLTAEAGIAVLRIGFERWIEETNQQDCRQLIRDSLDQLEAAIAGE